MKTRYIPSAILLASAIYLSGCYTISQRGIDALNENTVAAKARTIDNYLQIGANLNSNSSEKAKSDLERVLKEERADLVKSTNRLDRITVISPEAKAQIRKTFELQIEKIDKYLK